VEALIRWNHPERGLLLPSAFIPIAETSGNVGPIGEWVIEHACRQIKSWRDAGIMPAVVGVNLSGAQFKLASQLDRIVADRLRHYNIAPERLELELVESVLIEIVQRHSESLARLRKSGVQLAVQNFGSGYSSLDYLRQFRVARLKIDQRFVRQAPTCPDDAAVVRAAVGLARELGIPVVAADGVETKEQRDFLIAAGCKIAQGHFFGTPAPAAAVTDLLRRSD
jgi:EAL domain-containing protein (putative c-di-GMP-specific phosphodiesterase class I)